MGAVVLLRRLGAAGELPVVVTHLAAAGFAMGTAWAAWAAWVRPPRERPWHPLLGWLLGTAVGWAGQELYSAASVAHQHTDPGVLRLAAAAGMYVAFAVSAAGFLASIALVAGGVVEQVRARLAGQNDSARPR